MDKEARDFSETVINIYQATGCYIWDYCILQIYPPWGIWNLIINTTNVHS